MAHTNIWDDAPLVIGDQAGEGYDNINTIHTDVSERMQLEHNWNGGAGGLNTDGLHIPGKAAVVVNQSTAATIVANAGAFLAAYNGSVAMASDTGVVYVKKGAANATNGTWTAIAADREFGTWTSKSVDTSYLAAESGFVTATLTVIHNNTAALTGMTDSSNPPTTVRAQAYSTRNWDARVDGSSLCMPVKTGDYYKVAYTQIIGSTTGSVLVYWLPLTVA